MGTETQETAPDCTGTAQDSFYGRLAAFYRPGGPGYREPRKPELVAVPGTPADAAYAWYLYEKRLARTNAASARRHAAKLKRTPPWADQAAIKAIYAEASKMTQETGVEHHVDHIYPLQGKKVSGLHVHTNLQVLVGVENMRKGNRHEP